MLISMHSKHEMQLKYSLNNVCSSPACEVCSPSPRSWISFRFAQLLPQLFHCCSWDLTHISGRFVCASFTHWHDKQPSETSVDYCFPAHSGWAVVQVIARLFTCRWCVESVWWRLKTGQESGWRASSQRCRKLEETRFMCENSCLLRLKDKVGQQRGEPRVSHLLTET